MLHPDKCRFDYITQNGQGNLKGHAFNINVPSKPAWEHLTKVQIRSHPGLADESNRSNQYRGRSSIFPTIFYGPIKIPQGSTQLGELWKYIKRRTIRGSHSLPHTINLKSRCSTYKILQAQKTIDIADLIVPLSKAWLRHTACHWLTTIWSIWLANISNAIIDDKIIKCYRNIEMPSVLSSIIKVWVKILFR